ncbi:unnamed protein product [Rotaria sordida]|uniref:Uncharacterized protein n=1 Tax=Rotaria sordida TaxID=392033 RepID=A0A815RXR8_9BILA|nr:unnamed protein product [Rotaria sordida]CAF1648557.1 unnamed protein product [Rotaria sordida]
MFTKEFGLRALAGDFILRNLLSEQITDLNIDIQYDIIAQSTISLSEKFALILSLSKRLISLNFCQLFHYRKKLPRLKHFSLTSFDDTIYYDKLIIPLLCRMINLEELILFLSIIRFNSTFIDGIQLYDQFLIYIPRLNKFTFSIITVVVNNNIHLSSHKDIQHSFIGRRYGQVGS